MRYTCLDVRSPDVNFLRKVMSSSRHDGAAYSRHPCRQSADADIVSAFPLPFSTFLENINILRQTSSTWHRIRREFYVLESFQKPVAPAGYKNKQCRKQTSVLSGRIVTAYVPLRSATERERAAFLIPCQGLRGYFAKFQVNYRLISPSSASSSVVMAKAILVAWSATLSSPDTISEKIMPASGEHSPLVRRSTCFFCSSRSFSST